MSLELAVEMRRLKLIEERLAVLSREAADLTETQLDDLQNGHPVASLRLLMATNQHDVREALQEWEIAKRRVAEVMNRPAPDRRKRRALARGT